MTTRVAPKPNTPKPKLPGDFGRFARRQVRTRVASGVSRGDAIGQVREVKNTVRTLRAGGMDRPAARQQALKDGTRVINSGGRKPAPSSGNIRLGMGGNTPRPMPHPGKGVGVGAKPHPGRGVGLNKPRPAR